MPRGRQEALVPDVNFFSQDVFICKGEHICFQDNKHFAELLRKVKVKYCR